MAERHEARFRVAGVVTRAPKIGRGDQKSYAFMTVEIEGKNRSSYVDLAAFDEVVDDVERQKMRGGETVVFGGRVATRKIEGAGKEGRDLWVPQLVVEAIKLVARGNGPKERKPRPPKADPPPPTDGGAPVDGDDDIPF